jgi:hypothetical protein
MIPPPPDPGEIRPAGDIDVSGFARVPPPAYRWYHRLFAVMLATACLIVGAVLLAFPWTPSWEHNYFAGVTPFFRRCKWHRHGEPLHFAGGSLAA